jgi:hypothetical protein
MLRYFERAGDEKYVARMSVPNSCTFPYVRFDQVINLYVDTLAVNTRSNGTL